MISFIVFVWVDQRANVLYFSYTEASGKHSTVVSKYNMVGRPQGVKNINKGGTTTDHENITVVNNTMWSSMLVYRCFSSLLTTLYYST